MLPVRSRAVTQYDPAQRQLHAVDWQGQPLVCDTPAELLQALVADRVYASTMVHAAALWFAADHGVPWQLPSDAPAPLVRLQQRSSTEGYRRSALQRCRQAFDRAYEQTIQLVLPMIEATDVVCIVDADGVLAQILSSALQQMTPAPTVLWLRDGTLPAETTVLLVHTVVNRDGCVVAPAVVPLVDAARSTGVSRYALAPFGPVDAGGVLPADAVHAVVTGRGMYRPDRITRYDDDSDYGPDIISLT